MIRHTVLAGALAVAAFAQTPAPAPAKGSISGVARDMNTGVPVSDAEITASNPPMRPVNVTSDAQGRFTLQNLDPGRIQLSARRAATLTTGFGILTRKFVTLAAGQNLGSVDLPVRTNAQVSGTARDQNDEPVPDLSVFLVTREYQLGELRYVFAGATRTDDQGEYILARAEPGRAYMLLAMRIPGGLTVNAISNAPLDPLLRRPAVIPTYYPGVDSAEGAQTFVLRSGELRENADIRLVRSPSYCLEGALPQSGAGAMRFSIIEASPHSGTSGEGGLYIGTTNGQTGPDGRLRVCDLHPGQYRITVNSSTLPGSTEPPEFFATAVNTVTDGDSALVVTPLPLIQMKGELVWAQTPLESFTLPNNWAVGLDLITRSRFRGEATISRVQTVGPFMIENLFTDEYRVRMPAIPLGGDVYVKDVTYGGRSMLREPFRPGTASGDQPLRVILAHDGGRVKATVADREGKALADQHVIVLPKEIRSQAELADTAVSGQTDQNGAWTSATLAPGKYYVLASRTPFDRTPETVGALWSARDRGKEIEVAPGETVEAAVSPVN